MIFGALLLVAGLYYAFKAAEIEDPARLRNIGAGIGAFLLGSAMLWYWFLSKSAPRINHLGAGGWISTLAGVAMLVGGVYLCFKKVKPAEASKD